MKNNNYTIIGIGILIIGLICVYLFSQSERYNHMGWGWSKDRGSADYSKDTPGGEMMHGKDGGSMMSGISERAFIEHMIPHHQEAVDTAKQVVARGENAEVKALAEGIIVAQEKEIADMKSWYKNWYGTEFKDDGSYETMMRDLSALSGNALDRAFVEDMIHHHMGALMMNQKVIPNIEHDEVRALATAIAETQSAEIVTIRIMLKSL